MSEESIPPITMTIEQAQALVAYVENPENTTGVDLLTWTHYYQAKIALLQSQLPTTEKIRYTHLHQRPRALTAIELERYLVREVEYLRERLAYVEKKLQQLWQTGGLTAHQVQHHSRRSRAVLYLSRVNRDVGARYLKGGCRIRWLNSCKRAGVLAEH